MGNEIQIKPQPYQYQNDCYFVESDWTAASYWYAMAVLAEDCNIVLKGLLKSSHQGDRILAELFTIYGIKSDFSDAGVILTKAKNTGFIHIYDFIDHPDLVQTFAFLNASLGLPMQVNNAANLKLKETDRIGAISNELIKIGATLSLKSGDDFYIENKQPGLIENTSFLTYKDHRMAMCVAPLALIYQEIKINNEEVVNKSYPSFWDDICLAGFEIKKY
jgi:3-phosphoshikimate 1-carboxyvinyltransferase